MKSTILFFPLSLLFLLCTTKYQPLMCWVIILWLLFYIIYVIISKKKIWYKEYVLILFFALFISLLIIQYRENRNYYALWCGHAGQVLDRQSSFFKNPIFRTWSFKDDFFSPPNLSENVPFNSSWTIYKISSNQTYELKNIYGKYHTNIVSPHNLFTWALSLPSLEGTNISFIRNFLWKHLVFDENIYITWRGELFCYPLTPKIFSREFIYRSKWYRGKITFTSFTISSKTWKKIYDQKKIPFVTSTTSRNNSLSFPTFFTLEIAKLSSFFYSPDIEEIYASLTQWIVLGDTSTIPRPIYDIFLKSWLVYLISASGSNITTIVSLLWLLLFYISFRYKRLVLLLSVTIYMIYLSDNIALFRAFLSYLVLFVVIWRGYQVSSRKTFFIVLFIIAFINPYLFLSSRGLLLSAWGVWWLIHIPSSFQKTSLQRFFIPALFANIGIIWPLLFLIQSYNIVTIFLWLLAAPLASFVVILYIFSFIPFIHHIMYGVVHVILVLASRWASHGYYIAVTPTISCIIRGICWIVLRRFYIYKTKKYFAIM